MASEIIEVVETSGTVELVDSGRIEVVELDTGGQVGPRGPIGPMGESGEQGPQGRSTLNIFQRDTTMPSEPNTPNTCLLYTSPSPRDS